MDLVIRMPHVFNPASTAVENARALRIMLETLIQLDSAFLVDHNPPSLYRSGVVYGRTTEWDTIPALYQRRFGDCKSLSAARIAELRKNGVAAKPVFRWIKRGDGSGATDFHILVQTKDGFEDPSKKLGMNAENARPPNGSIGRDSTMIKKRRVPWL